MLNPQAKAAAVLKGPDGRSMSKLLLDEWHSLADTGRHSSVGGSHFKRTVNRVRGIFQLPKFSVIVWVRKTDEFEAICKDLISLVGDEPFETTEYEGMIDFHWGPRSTPKPNRSQAP